MIVISITWIIKETEDYLDKDIDTEVSKPENVLEIVDDISSMVVEEDYTGDFNPTNVIINEKGEHYIIDWSHATSGNASADAARTFLLFSMEGKAELAEKYLNLFAKKSTIEKANIQRWIPIVAATQLTKGHKEEQEFLSKWIDVADYE